MHVIHLRFRHFMNILNVYSSIKYKTETRRKTFFKECSTHAFAKTCKATLDPYQDFEIDKHGWFFTKGHPPPLPRRLKWPKCPSYASKDQCRYLPLEKFPLIVSYASIRSTKLFQQPKLLLLASTLNTTWHRLRGTMTKQHWCLIVTRIHHKFLIHLGNKTIHQIKHIMHQLLFT